MTDPVALPFWLFALLLCLALWSVLVLLQIGRASCRERVSPRV